MRSSGLISACPPAQGLELIGASCWGSGGEVGVEGGGEYIFFGVGEEEDEVWM